MTVRPLADRAAAAILQAIAHRLWGFPPNLMPAIVDRLGAAGALRWFIANMPRYERTRTVFRPLRTHLLCVEVSLLNGCPYCTFGHAYAFELLYLAERDALFPVDEHEFVSLHEQPEAAIVQRLSDALQQAGLGEEISWFERLRALRQDPTRAANRDDQRIVHLLQMFEVLNACGIESRAVPDQAHDPVNKQRQLKRRYEALRAGRPPFDAPTAAVSS